MSEVNGDFDDLVEVVVLEAALVPEARHVINVLIRAHGWLVGVRFVV